MAPSATEGHWPIELGGAGVALSGPGARLAAVGRKLGRPLLDLVFVGIEMPTGASTLARALDPTVSLGISQQAEHLVAIGLGELGQAGRGLPGVVCHELEQLTGRDDLGLARLSCRAPARRRLSGLDALRSASLAP